MVTYWCSHCGGDMRREALDRAVYCPCCWTNNCNHDVRYEDIVESALDHEARTGESVVLV